MTTNPLDIINRHFVGFDDMYRALERGATAVKVYPPHNVIRVDENHTRIELAVAGFSREDLEVEVANNTLTVRGTRPESDETVEYLFRGLSARSFTKKWTLDRHLEVQGVRLENGVLTIDVVREIPEEEKPRVIDIQ